MPHATAMRAPKTGLRLRTEAAPARSLRRLALDCAKNPRARLSQRMRSHGFFAALGLTHGGVK